MQVEQLDPRLHKDSYVLGTIDQHLLLLMRNALYPWFVIVPDTKQIEFYKLDDKLQQQLLDQINQLSDFVEANFPIEKMNIAMIGNVVAQLHIHVVGRHRGDASWPNVVWGAKPFAEYDTMQIEAILTALSSHFTGFRAL